MDEYRAMVVLDLLDKAEILEGKFVRILPFLPTIPNVWVWG
jgi:hypothetical protein